MGDSAHCDARTVDDGRDIVRMGVLDPEGDDRLLVLGGAEDAQRIDLGQPLLGIRDKPRLVPAWSIY